MIRVFKKKLRPLYQYLEKKYFKYKTFNVDISKLLRGGENGIRAAKYAELTNDFMRPSTPVTLGPHVLLLRQYEEIGDEIFEEHIFKKTAYYQNAEQCIRLTGSYFYDRPEKIIELARRFIKQHQGVDLDLPKQPGQSDADTPVWVRPIRESQCYEVIDGNHRIARAIMRGEQTIKAFVYENEAVYTPLQQLLLDCLWINKRKWLYQPVESPELLDQWVLIRQSADRVTHIQHYLSDLSLISKTHIDIGSSYGFVVSQMLQAGYDAFGMERDPFGMDVGFKVYGLPKERIIHSDAVLGLEELVRQGKKYSSVSCLSVLHHFVLGKSSTSASEFLTLLDSITQNVLFLDTGEDHETAFGDTLKGWSPEFIRNWIIENSSFKKVTPIGTDNDRKPPFEGYYQRTLFACER